MKKYVAYYRVSTARQGQSGLGLDAQQASVQAYLTHGHGELLASFTGVESGSHDSRPQLAAAMAAAKQASATLLIAKLDRLSRNASFIFALRDARVDFVCCDMPDANTLTVGIFAVLAQHERETIGSRTRAALAQLKERGVQLGTPANLTNDARAKGRATQQRQASECGAKRQAAAHAALLKQTGKTVREIAEALNQLGFRTRGGSQYHSSTVHRLLQS